MPPKLHCCFFCFFRGEWRGMFLESDVILETVTYGGVVNAACHGVGQTQVGQREKRGKVVGVTLTRIRRSLRQCLFFL